MDTATQKINRAAAAMAVLNYGFDVDHSRVLRWEPNLRYGNSPRQEICDLAGHLIESDEHGELFAGEADGWAAQITEEGGLLQFAEKYHWHKPWILQLEAL